MPIYVCEIGGRGIAAFGHVSTHRAEVWMEDEDLHRDLRVFQSNGAPLWDGKAELALRLANADEQAKWESSYRQAGYNVDAADAGGREWLTYLVPIVDPTDDHGDDDDDDDDNDFD